MDPRSARAEAAFLAAIAADPSLLATPHTAQPVLVTLANVTPTKVEWLWWPYIASGTVSLLDGDPGVGKSLLTLQLATSISRGWPLPDQYGKLTELLPGPQNVLILSTEDSLAHTVVPRLLAINADCARVTVLTGQRIDEQEETAFTLQDLPVLQQAIDTLTPTLVILDPIQAYLGKIDMHRSNETRPLLAALASIAEHARCSILCVRHPSKSQNGGAKAMMRGLGSVDFVGAARTALFVEDHPTKRTCAFLCETKNNLGPHGRTQIFSREKGQFAWAGVTRLTADHIAGGERGPDPHEFIRAMCWLEEQLEGGIPQPSKDLFFQAEELGMSKRSLGRAKLALGVRHKKSDEGYMWSLQTVDIIQR